MNFVEVGRVVAPRSLEDRELARGVITGIIDNKFLVIMKQDKSHEIVRVEEIILQDTIYTVEELKDENCEFYKSIENIKEGQSDFDRFVVKLRNKISDEIVNEKIKF